MLLQLPGPAAIKLIKVMQDFFMYNKWNTLKIKLELLPSDKKPICVYVLYYKRNWAQSEMTPKLDAIHDQEDLRDEPS